jgi:hypothetical protein
MPDTNAFVAESIILISQSVDAKASNLDAGFNVYSKVHP